MRYFLFKKTKAPALDELGLPTRRASALRAYRAMFGEGWKDSDEDEAVGLSYIGEAHTQADIAALMQQHYKADARFLLFRGEVETLQFALPIVANGGKNWSTLEAEWGGNG